MHALLHQARILQVYPSQSLQLLCSLLKFTGLTGLTTQMGSVHWLTRIWILLVALMRLVDNRDECINTILLVN